MTDATKAPTPAKPAITAATPKQRPRLMRALVVGAGAVAAITLITVGANALIGTYRDQLSQAQSIEADAHPANLMGTGKLHTDARVQAFQSDPVFQSKEWAALTAASEKMEGGYFEQHDVPLLTKSAAEIWWPGLKERASAAVKDLHFDPASADATEFVAAAGRVAASCADKSLTTTDQRIAAWSARVGPVVKDDPYQAAQLAVMPAVFRAGAKYFCN